jgi:hypothetical protein
MARHCRRPGTRLALRPRSGLWTHGDATVALVPQFFESHVYAPPPTANLLHRGRMAWACACGRRWRLEWFISADGVRRLGLSWILQ